MKPVYIYYEAASEKRQLEADHGIHQSYKG